MIKHDLADLFRQSSIHKKFVINYDGGTITNSDMLLEEFSLEESICSEEELRFGSCEASVVRFPISNVFTSLNGKVLDVSVVLDHNEDKPLKIGKYKVASDVPTADRKRKDITAYDALYDVINANVADWYNALLPNADSTVTFKQFRDSFFDYFGIEQVEVALINDSMIVTKTIQPTELSGSMVANAICELNGCFGHINRDGLMDYVFLKERWDGLYPADDLFPAEDIFPSDDNFFEYTSSDYSVGACEYSDYVSRKITGLEIRQEENSVGVFVGEKENPYVVSDNFLTYGKSVEEMTAIAQNMFNTINGIEYRPFKLKTFRGNPCVEVGDGIKIYTDNQIIESYVLNRTLTGIQALNDDFETNGKEYRSAQVNSFEKSLIQLRGKTNVLERSIDETRSEITKKAEEVIKYADEAADSALNDANASTDDKLKEYSTTAEMRSAITQSADEISLEVSKTYSTKGEAQELSSKIQQTAEELNTRVEKGEVISEINQSAEEVRIQASKISLEGTVTANGNFIVKEDGSIEAKNGKFKGNVNADSLIVMDGIALYNSAIGIPTPFKAIYVENDSVGFFSRLALYDYTKIGNVYISPNSIYCDFLDISSSTGGVRMASSATPSLRPLKHDVVNLGNPDYYYKQIYCNKSAVDLSDENKKEDIRDITEKYEQLFFKVKPKLFRFKNTDESNHDRVHIGTTSQGVEKAMKEVGLDALELAFFCKDVAKREIENKDGTLSEELVLDENGNKTYNYGLRYGEWIMLNTHMVQKLYKKVDEQQTEIDELKKSVSFLMEKLGGMANE